MFGDKTLAGDMRAGWTCWEGGEMQIWARGGECEVEIASREGEKVVENHVPAREEYAEKLREEPLAIGE